MGRSSQEQRRARFGTDSAGESHYPGDDYVFDWPNSWPSGSESGQQGPELTVSPVITGTPLEGETLTLSTLPVWDGTETSSGYVWQRSGVDILGTTDTATYVIPDAPITGTLWTVRAFSSGPTGNSSKLSNVLTSPVPVPDITSLPDKTYGVGIDLPHTLNVAAFNTGGLAASVTSSYGSVTGSVITFPNVEASEVVTVTATNATGSDSVTINVDVVQTLPVPNIATIPDQDFDEGLNLPHTLVVGAFNTGGSIASVTTSYGTVAGDVITFPDIPTSQTVTITATNATGSDTETINLIVNEALTSITIFATSFNDTTDEAGFSTTALGTLYWATHLTTDSLTADGSGGWTGNTLETGSTEIIDATDIYPIPYSNVSGPSGSSRRVSYYIRNGAIDSNVITETYTIN